MAAIQIKLPSWAEVCDAREEGRMTPLDEFIWSECPGHPEHERKFRADLEAAIRACVTITKEAP